MIGKLILIRHHESEWNKLGKWTGSTDVDLTDYGFEMSKKMGSLLTDLTIHQAFASTQARSSETLLGIEKALSMDVPVTRDAALNERDYGDYTGMNKWEVEKLIGAENFNHLRRGWNYPVPNGETLKMVYERIVPYYLKNIVPFLKSGKTVLLVAHGNSIRALMKYIEKISDDDIIKLEMLFGSVVIYDVDEEGHMVHKEIRETESQVSA